MKRVKLYNFSRLPDEELRACLEHAAVQAGCDGPIVVKVTRGGRRVRSCAHRCVSVAKWFLSARARTKRGEYKEGWVPTNGGYVVLQPLHRTDPLDYAEHLYGTALHELAHVADMQQRKPFSQYQRQWANRPHERRAITAATFGMLKQDKERDERILNLAIAIEQSRL